MSFKNIDTDALRSENVALQQVGYPPSDNAWQESTDALAASVMELDGVEGVGHGANDTMVVFLSKPGLESRVHTLTTGHRVEFRYSGTINAQQTPF